MTPSTLQDHELSQSISGVSIQDYDQGSMCSDSSATDEETPVKAVKRFPQQILGGLYKKIKFDILAPGGYPFPPKERAIRVSGLTVPIRAVQREPRELVQTTNKKITYVWCRDQWSVSQGKLPMFYDRTVPLSSSREWDLDYERHMAVQSTRISKVKDFANSRMSGEEYSYWENWSGAKNHPFRAVQGEPDFAKVPLNLWPFYLIRTPNLSLYQMCRHEMGVPLPQLKPIRVYNRQTKEYMVIWLPEACGYGTYFHKRMMSEGNLLPEP